MAEPLGKSILAKLEGTLAGRLRTARELLDLQVASGRAASEPAGWAAALPELAALLADGLPRGALTELVGRRTSGRMGFVLALVAAATASGENAALVDLGDGLDPQRAVATGVALDRLLWARPQSLRQALAATEALLAGGFPLVVADLGLLPVPGGRGTAAQWLRLARAARDHGSRLLVSTPTRCCGVAAAAALRLARPHPRWLGPPRGPRLLDGVEAELVLDKARGDLRQSALP